MSLPNNGPVGCQKRQLGYEVDGQMGTFPPPIMIHSDPLLTNQEILIILLLWKKNKCMSLLSVHVFFLNTQSRSLVIVKKKFQNESYADVRDVLGCLLNALATLKLLTTNGPIQLFC